MSQCVVCGDFSILVFQLITLLALAVKVIFDCQKDPVRKVNIVQQFQITNQNYVVAVFAMGHNQKLSA